MPAIMVGFPPEALMCLAEDFRSIHQAAANPVDTSLGRDVAKKDWVEQSSVRTATKCLLAYGIIWVCFKSIAMALFGHPQFSDKQNVK